MRNLAFIDKVQIYEVKESRSYVEDNKKDNTRRE